MVVRDGISKEQAARVVPVLVGFNHFGACRGDKLTSINLQAFAEGSEVGQIYFLQILSSARKGGSNVGAGIVHCIDRLAETECNAEAQRSGLVHWLIQLKFNQV